MKFESETGKLLSKIENQLNKIWKRNWKIVVKIWKTTKWNL